MHTGPPRRPKYALSSDSDGTGAAETALGDDDFAGGLNVAEEQPAVWHDALAADLNVAEEEPAVAPALEWGDLAVGVPVAEEPAVVHDDLAADLNVAEEPAVGDDDLAADLSNEEDAAVSNTVPVIDPYQNMDSRNFPYGCRPQHAAPHFSNLPAPRWHRAPDHR